MAPFFPGSVATGLGLFEARNNKFVTLTAAVGSGDLTIPIDSSTPFPSEGIGTFEDDTDEIIKWTGKTPTSLTGVTRGFDNTTPVPHNIGVTIGMFWVAKYHNDLVAELIAVEQNIANRIGLDASVLKVVPGAVGAPSVQSNLDPLTGIYFSGIGSVDITATGSRVVSYDTTGVKIQPGKRLLVGATSGPLSSANTGASDVIVFGTATSPGHWTALELAGQMTGANLRVGRISFLNEFLGGGDDRIAEIEGIRYEQDASGAFLFNVWDSGTKRIFQLHTGLFGPAGMPSAPDLGSSADRWGVIYANSLNLAGGLTLSQYLGDDQTPANVTHGFISESGLGLYKYGPAALGWATGGLNRMVLTNAGYLGLGIGTPGYHLEVYTDQDDLVVHELTLTNLGGSPIGPAGVGLAFDIATDNVGTRAHGAGLIVRRADGALILNNLESRNTAQPDATSIKIQQAGQHPIEFWTDGQLRSSITGYSPTFTIYGSEPVKGQGATPYFTLHDTVSGKEIQIKSDNGAFEVLSDFGGGMTRIFNITNVGDVELTGGLSGTLGTITIGTDNRINLNDTGTFWMGYTSDHGGIVFSGPGASYYTDFNFAGPVAIQTNTGADGSGSWSPYININAEGDFQFVNFSQGNPNDRRLSLFIDQDNTSGFHYILDVNGYLRLGYNANGASRTAAAINAWGTPLELGSNSNFFIQIHASNGVTIRGSRWPSGLGTAGQYLQTNGAGTLTWADVAGVSWPMLAPNGTEAAPSYSWENAQDWGWSYSNGSPATEKVILSMDGVGKVAFKKVGAGFFPALGIGTTTPTFALDLNLENDSIDESYEAIQITDKRYSSGGVISSIIQVRQATDNAGAIGVAASVQRYYDGSLVIRNESVYHSSFTQNALTQLEGVAGKVRMGFSSGSHWVTIDSAGNIGLNGDAVTSPIGTNLGTPTNVLLYPSSGTNLLELKGVAGTGEYAKIGFTESVTAYAVIAAEKPLSSTGRLKFQVRASGLTDKYFTFEEDGTFMALLPQISAQYEIGAADNLWRSIYSVRGLHDYMFLYNSGRTQTIGHQAVPGITGSTTYQWPTDGTTGQILSTNGSGVLSWITAGVSWPLLAPDGSELAPSYSWANQTNMGFFRDYTDSVVLAFSGNWSMGWYGDYTTAGQEVVDFWMDNGTTSMLISTSAGSGGQINLQSNGGTMMINAFGGYPLRLMGVNSELRIITNYAEYTGLGFYPTGTASFGTSTNYWSTSYLSTIYSNVIQLWDLDKSNYVQHKAVDALTGDTIYKWPASGTVGQILQTDGAGGLSWITPSGGGSGTVNVGTLNQVAYYASAGDAVSGTDSLKINGTGVDIAGTIRMVDDAQLIFGNTDSSWMKFSSNHGDILINSTYISFPGGIGFYSNTGLDGSGSWEPSIDFDSTSGWINIFATYGAGGNPNQIRFVSGQALANDVYYRQFFINYNSDTVGRTVEFGLIGNGAGGAKAARWATQSPILQIQAPLIAFNNDIQLQSAKKIYFGGVTDGKWMGYNTLGSSTLIINTGTDASPSMDFGSKTDMYIWSQTDSDWEPFINLESTGGVLIENTASFGTQGGKHFTARFNEGIVTSTDFDVARFERTSAERILWVGYSVGAGPQWDYAYWRGGNKFSAATNIHIGNYSLDILNLVTTGQVEILQNELRWINGSYYMAFKAGTLTANNTYIWPTSYGTSGYFLQTDGAGNLTWAAAGGGGLTWPLTAPDGTTGAPSYSWSSDSTKGFSYDATDGLTVLSGLLRLPNNSSGVCIQMGSGTNIGTIGTTGSNDVVIKTYQGVGAWNYIADFSTANGFRVLQSAGIQNQGGYKFSGYSVMGVYQQNGGELRLDTESAKWMKFYVGGQQFMELTNVGPYLSNDVGLYWQHAGFSMGFKASTSLASNITFTWPNGYGTSGQVLTTNGAGALSWTTVGGGAVTVNPGTAWYFPVYYDANTIGASPTLLHSGSDITCLQNFAISNDKKLRLGNDQHYIRYNTTTTDLEIYGTNGLSLNGNVWPTGSGTSGYFLQTNGAGTLSWAAAGGVSFPLSAPGGGESTPDYSFSGYTSTGLTMDSGYLVLSYAGQGLIWINGSTFALATLGTEFEFQGNFDLAQYKLLWTNNSIEIKTGAFGMDFKAHGTSGHSFWVGGTEEMRIQSAGVTMVQNDRKFIFGNSGDAYFQPDNTNQVIYMNSSSSTYTELSSIGGLYLDANVGVGGSGNWDPNISLSDSGYIQFDSLYQGSAGTRGFRFRADNGVAAGDYEIVRIVRGSSTIVGYFGYRAGGSSVTEALIRATSTPLVINANGADSAKFDDSATADDCRFLLWDVTSGSMKRVSRGAADSGGTGYRLLRIPN